MTRSGAVVALTATQYDIFVMLLRDAGRVVSKAQILSYVRGRELWDGNIVEVHVSALRRKLEAHGPRLIHTIRGAGYVFRPSELSPP